MKHLKENELVQEYNKLLYQWETNERYANLLLPSEQDVISILIHLASFKLYSYYTEVAKLAVTSIDTAFAVALRRLVVPKVHVLTTSSFRERLMIALLPSNYTIVNWDVILNNLAAKKEIVLSKATLPTARQRLSCVGKKLNDIIKFKTAAEADLTNCDIFIVAMSSWKALKGFSINGILWLNLEPIEGIPSFKLEEYTIDRPINLDCKRYRILVDLYEQSSIIDQLSSELALYEQRNEAVVTAMRWFGNRKNKIMCCIHTKGYNGGYSETRDIDGYIVSEGVQYVTKPDATNNFKAWTAKQYWELFAKEFKCSPEEVQTRANEYYDAIKLRQMVVGFTLGKQQRILDICAKFTTRSILVVVPDAKDCILNLEDQINQKLRVTTVDTAFKYKTEAELFTEKPCIAFIRENDRIPKVNAIGKTLTVAESRATIVDLIKQKVKRIVITKPGMIAEFRELLQYFDTVIVSDITAQPSLPAAGTDKRTRYTYSQFEKAVGYRNSATKLFFYLACRKTKDVEDWQVYLPNNYTDVIDLDEL